jgi:hypothetical protein
MDISSLVVCFFIPYSFREYQNQPLSTQVISNPLYFKASQGPSTTITVSNGLYQLLVNGIWQTATADPGTRGTATAIRLIGSSSGSHGTSTSVTGTIKGVAYVFTIVTMVGAVEMARQEDGTQWLQEDGTQVYQEELPLSGFMLFQDGTKQLFQDNTKVIW